MNTAQQRSSALILFVLFCTLFPLLENLHPATLWGLNWQSPQLMAELGYALMFIKLLLLGLAFYLLLTRTETIRNTLTNRGIRYSYVGLNYVLILLQIPLLLIWIGYATISASPSAYNHQEHNVANHTIYTHTVNLGATSEASHLLYLKCPRPLHRYALAPLARINWVGAFDLQADADDILVLNSNTNKVLHRIDRAELDCNTIL